jgi:hypothetical protein
VRSQSEEIRVGDRFIEALVETKWHCRPEEEEAHLLWTGRWVKELMARAGRASTKNWW